MNYRVTMPWFTVCFTVAKYLTAVSTKTFSEKNHPSWFDWSVIVLYTSLNESRSFKMSLGLALSFEIISSSIRILLTRITVSIPNPKSNEFLRFRFTLKWYSKYANRSSIDVLTVYALCPSYYFPAGVCLEDISMKQPKQTTLCRRHTHTRLCWSNSSGWMPRFALAGARHKHWPISAQATCTPDLGTQ